MSFTEQVGRVVAALVSDSAARPDGRASLFTAADLEAARAGDTICVRCGLPFRVVEGWGGFTWRYCVGPCRRP